MHRLIGFGLIALIVVGVGCAKFTRANYEAVSVGMSDKAEVRGLLGDPRAESDDMWFYSDNEKLVQAKIFFDDSGLVAQKKWEDMTDLDSFTLSDEPWMRGNGQQ